MKIYYFGGAVSSTHSNIDDLEDIGFDGVLFTYSPYDGDMFTLVARTLKLNQKIKYMIAVRPHTMSAQFLCTINDSFSKIQKNRLEINIISGHIKPEEKFFGGILGDITDNSSVPDRTNYMIEYVKELENMKNNEKVKVPDYYISCTNPYSFKVASELNQKIILPYINYKNKYFKHIDDNGQTKPGEPVIINNETIMLAINPIIRDTIEEIDKEFPKNILIHNYDNTTFLDRNRQTLDTEFFTYDEFKVFVQNLESEGIYGILLNATSPKENENFLQYMKKYIRETR